MAPVQLSPDGRYSWNGSGWVPVGRGQASRGSRFLQFGIPAFPILLAVLLSLVSPLYLQPMFSNALGLTGVAIVVALSVGGWLVYPHLYRASTPARYVLIGLWFVLVTLPGTFIVLIFPALVTIARGF